MTTEKDILATFTSQERASAQRLNARGREIRAQIWRDQPRPRSHDHYVLDANHIAIPVGMGTSGIWMNHEFEKLQRGEPSLRLVRRDRGGAFRVSTEFLGADRSYGKGPRQLFETTVLTRGGGGCCTRGTSQRGGPRGS